MTTAKSTSPQIAWLDCAKCAAIFAVLLNHTGNFAGELVYASDWIETFSLYCVSLFVLIAGMTSYLSNQKHRWTWWAAFLHNSKKIFAVYAGAVAVYQIVGALEQGPETLWNLDSYVYHLYHFDLPAPAYYVSVHLQLMLTSRFLYRCIKGFPQRFCLVWEIGLGGVLLLFAAWSTQYTNILGVYGGGGKLLGGTYLFLYYLGMLMMKHSVFEPVSRKRSQLYLAVSTPLLAAWFVMIHLTNRRIDTWFPFGSGFNPPSVSLMVFAVLMLFFVYGLCTLLQAVPVLCGVMTAVAFIGRNTLYIFLYHWLVLQYFILHRPNTPFRGVIVLACLILLPIGWGYIVRAVVRFFRRLQRLDA